MRKFIDAITLNEDEITKGDIKKGTWTYWQDHDGIYVICPGSNSCFAGFSSEDEAKHFAAEQGPEWKAIRWGKFKTMSDDEALQDYDVRNRRQQHGFWNSPLQEEAHEHRWMRDANSDSIYCTHPGCMETADDEEDEESAEETAAYERQRRIEKAVKEFCEKEVKLDMDSGYSVIFDPEENQLSLSPSDDEISFEQLSKLSSLGQLQVNATSRAWSLTIEIKTPQGFDIMHAEDGARSPVGRGFSHRNEWGDFS